MAVQRWESEMTSALRRGRSGHSDVAERPSPDDPSRRVGVIGGRRLLVSAAVIAMLLAGCGKPAEDARPQSSAPVSVVTAAASQVEWSDRIGALGTARASESVVVTAKVTETVARVNFDDGDYVTEGQLLVDLTGRAEVASLEEAQANYTESLQQFRRQAELVEAGTIARSQLDTLVATRDANKARMDAIRARLADRVIVAPFEGVLGFRQVSPGTLVTPGTPIVTLDDVSPINLDFSVPERFLADLAAGQTVRARSAAWPEQEFVGEVSNVGSRVDPVTRSVVVRAEIPNDNRRLRPGMLLTLDLVLPARSTIIIPELALTQVGESQTVMRVRADDTVEEVSVRSGARRDGDVEIVEGLAPGDRIVVEGVVKLRPGMSVVEAPAASSASATLAN